MMRAALSVLPAVALAVATVQHVTPVEKVVELLTKLQEQIHEEGAKEAAQYDKFACFCKDEASDKQVAIAKAEIRIKDMEAEIEMLESEIAKLDSDAQAAKKEEASVKTKSEQEAKVQSGQDKEFSEEVKELEDAVTVMKKAIDALKAAKDNVDAAKSGAALLAVSDVLRMHPALSSDKFGPVLLASVQDPTSYEHRSGDIITVLQELLVTFKKNLADKNTEVSTDRHEFNMLDSARSQKIGFLQEEIATKEKVSAKKSDEVAELKGNLEEDKEARKADEAFLEDLTSTCEDKAKAWDERSKFRANEITAISEALEVLKGPVSSNYAANKMVSGLVQKGAVAKQAKAEGEDAEDAEYDSQAKEDRAFLRRGSVSFVQLGEEAAKFHWRHAQRRVSLVHQRHKFMPLVSFLHKRATALKSVVLTGLAAKILTDGDHFAKVRGLIKDLIAKLKEAAAAEADQKGFCDKEMKAAVDSRDKHQGDMESLTAQIDITTTQISKLKSKIEELATEVAELYKAVKEMEELREKEKAQNEQTIADSKAGLAAVQNAMSILKGFYEGSLLQAGARAPAKDSEGSTVGDKAPETFEGDYKGKTGASKGIIGLLEIIESDFSRTVDETGSAEDSAAEKFTKDKADFETDIEKKQTEKTNAETEAEEKAADLVGFKDDLKDSTKMHEQSLEELEKLKPQCIDAAESWDQRNKKRQEEIEALKEAMKLLETFQS